MSTRILSRWTVAATLFLITFGGFTRGSRSGYGCADRWPLCEDGLLGGLIPRLEFHMIIEWTHRWLAALVGVLAIATAVIAWRHVRRWIAWLAVSGVVVIGIQAWVGRLVVVKGLDADLVSLHLAISVTVAALFTVVAVATTPSPAPRDNAWGYRYLIGAAVAVAVLMLGSLVHNLYFSGWPLVSNDFFPDLGNRYILLHYLHRLIAGVGLIYFGWLGWRAHTARRPRLEQVILWIGLAGYAINVGLGGFHVLTKVSWSGLVAAHLGAASLVWVCLVATAGLAAGLGDRQAST
jgi:heme A synthase